MNNAGIIIDKLRKDKKSITLDETEYLLGVSGQEQADLFEYAKKVRYKQIQNKVYIRAVIDISNYCRCNCAFCGNSVSSSKVKRYRLPKEEMLKAVRKAKELGIDVVHFASGEDPKFNFEHLYETIEEVLMLDMIPEIVPGRLTDEQIHKFFEKGARRYIMKFETSDSALFSKLKACGRDLGNTIDAIKSIKKVGYKVGSGNIIGMPGQTIQSIAKDLFLLRELDVDMASTSVFTPNKESQLSDGKKGDAQVALNFLALLRTVLQNERLCISSNSTFGEEGKIQAIKIGANVLSLNLTPEEYKGNYSLYSGKDRYKADFETVLGFIERAGMVRSTCKEVYLFGEK